MTSPSGSPAWPDCPPPAVRPGVPNKRPEPRGNLPLPSAWQHLPIKTPSPRSPGRLCRPRMWGLKDFFVPEVFLVVFLASFTRGRAWSAFLYAHGSWRTNRTWGRQTKPISGAGDANDSSVSCPPPGQVDLQDRDIFCRSLGADTGHTHTHTHTRHCIVIHHIRLFMKHQFSILWSRCPPSRQKMNLLR